MNKNVIEYFYNIKVDKINNENGGYSFIYNGYVYRLYVFNNDNNINFLIDTNKRMLGNTLVSEIIMNRNKDIISSYNGIDYILIRVYANTLKDVSLEEISYISNSIAQEKLNINWGMLWERKIDYLEDLINENGKKYPIIVDSFNYFVGMAENAISYYNNIVIDPNYKYTIGHKRIRCDDTVECLYNPLNLTLDYRVRDVAEYVKIAFFKNNSNIFIELDNYIKKNNLSLMEAKLLISRILYPSFYFDMYEDILIDDAEEKIILNVVSRLDDYEDYISKIIDFLRKYFDVDVILWLKKERI